MKPALLALLGLLLAAPASAQVDPYAHPGDQCQQREANFTDGKPYPLRYNPLPGMPNVLWFCGPRAAEPLTYQVEVDGVPVPSPGRLVMGYYFYSDRQIPDAGTNGLIPYVGPGPLLSLPSVGPHTIRVTYGADKQVATFIWIGSVCTCARDADGNPRPVGWFGFGSPVIQCHEVCAARRKE